MNSREVHATLEQLFRQEYSRLLAVLLRLFGPANFPLAEDVLQDAYSKALQHWQQHGIPEHPSAWLAQTAKNKALDTIRARKTQAQFAEDLTFYLESEWSLGATVTEEFSEHKIKDDQLRMIFMCCADTIKPENRLPFILQTLCGFTIAAIARALLLPEETVKKRLSRTKNGLRQHTFAIPEGDALLAAMDSVHTVLYLMFNEGYNSSHAEQPVTESLCLEAMGLLNLLASEQVVVNQDTLGLLALMHLLFARMPARLDDNRQAIPLDLQDRSLWLSSNIYQAQQALNFCKLAPPGTSGRFFIEAQIALLHCRAPSFNATDWPAIVALYQQLVVITQSPVAELNLSIAEAYAGNTQQAIERVNQLQNLKRLQNSHMPDAILAHLYAKLGNANQAQHHAQQARTKGGTPHEHRLMHAQIARLLGKA